MEFSKEDKFNIELTDCLLFLKRLEQDLKDKKITPMDYVIKGKDELKRLKKILSLYNIKEFDKETQKKVKKLNKVVKKLENVFNKISKNTKG